MVAYWYTGFRRFYIYETRRHMKHKLEDLQLCLNAQLASPDGRHHCFVLLKILIRTADTETKLEIFQLMFHVFTNLVDRNISRSRIQITLHRFVSIFDLELFSLGPSIGVSTKYYINMLCSFLSGFTQVYLHLKQMVSDILFQWKIFYYYRHISRVECTIFLFCACSNYDL